MAGGEGVIFIFLDPRLRGDDTLKRGDDKGAFAKKLKKK